MATTDYLKLRGRTWYVRVQIPPHLWKAAGGKREYIKTLKTGDLGEANKRKHPHIAAFKRRIEALEKQRPDDVLGDLYDKALGWREAMERAKGKVLYPEPDGTPYYATDEFLSQISEEAEEFLETHGERAATSFYKIAKGDSTPLRSHVEAWLADESGRLVAQTISQHRAAVTAFLSWAGVGVLVEDVTRKLAGGYVSQLIAPTSSLSRKTAQRHLSSLSSFWGWLQSRGFIDNGRDNPWLGHGIGKKSSRGGSGRKRTLWSDSALVKVLSGHYTPRYTETLHDLTRLALVTGARLDELCALKGTDVVKRDDGWWISIREGKTEAAERDVPVHDAAAHVLARRCKSADGFVFTGLIPGGPDKKRSWNVSKAFGHYARNLQLGAEQRTFHELRNTFTEAMEAAEVPESTTKLIIGHARHSMTYGRYSKGQRVQLRGAINKLHYAATVMKLIRKPTQNNERKKTSVARRSNKNR